MKLPTYRMVENQEHAQRLAYALRGLLESLKMDEDTEARFAAVTEAQKTLLGYKKTNPSFGL